jgi:hypothetical protein
MKGSSFTGSPSRRKPSPALEDFHVLTQPPILPPQLGQLLLLLGRQSDAFAGVDLGMLDPLAHRRLGQIEVPGEHVSLLRWLAWSRERVLEVEVAGGADAGAWRR